MAIFIVIIQLPNYSDYSAIVYNRDFYLPSSRGPLRIVNQEKHLGVIFDDKLSFSIHITEQVNKANRIMGAIRRSLTDLNSDNFRNLFTTMIRPLLEYAAAVWSPHMKKDIQLIENVQRRATKQLPKISKLPYSERLRQLDLPTLRYRLGFLSRDNGIPVHLS